MMKALVTGATGAVGPTLVRQLQRRSYHVRVLVRRPPPQNLFAGPVEFVTGDICDPSITRASVKDMDVVYHLAAKLHINNPSSKLDAEYNHINVEGTRCLVHAAQDAGVSRVIFFSTISVYGTSERNNILDENSPLSPQTVYAETKCRAEQIVLEAKKKDGGKPLGVVLRLAAVYGPNMKGNYLSLVKALNRGWFLPLGSGLNRRTLVFDQDVASAALLVAEHPKALGQIYNVTDGRIHTFNEILSAICQALGRRPPRYHLPVEPFRLLAGISERGLKMIGKTSPLTVSMVEKLLEDVAVSGERIQYELGFKPQFDLACGWQQTITRLIRH